MFTGIIGAIGIVSGVEDVAGCTRLTIASPGLRLDAGESIAVDGVCVTVLKRSRGRFAVDLSTETLGRTTLGALQVGAEVNLERCLRASDRMGGHVVLGHVDTPGRVTRSQPGADGALLVVRFPVRYSELVVEKGSIAVNGVSLTIARCGRDRFSVALIPYTLTATNLGRLRRGSPVNLEFDYLAKLVGRWLSAQRGVLAQKVADNRASKTGR